MTRLRTATAHTIWLTAAASALLHAQAPVTPAPTAPQVHIGSRVGESPTGYDDGGRRDPFVSLIVPKTPPAGKPLPGRAGTAAGLSSVSVSDVVVKGLVRSGTTLIALLQGPDGRTYMAKRQDHLQDGVVTRIDVDAVVFTERTADAAGVVRARDVRKPLRPVVSGGQS